MEQGQVPVAAPIHLKDVPGFGRPTAAAEAAAAGATTAAAAAAAAAAVREKS